MLTMIITHKVPQTWSKYQNLLNLSHCNYLIWLVVAFLRRFYMAFSNIFLFHWKVYFGFFPFLIFFVLLLMHVTGYV